MICKRCGTQLSGSAKFCSKCGCNLQEERGIGDKDKKVIIAAACAGGAVLLVLIVLLVVLVVRHSSSSDYKEGGEQSSIVTLDGDSVHKTTTVTRTSTTAVTKTEKPSATGFISGKVTDKDGKPIKGAVVTVTSESGSTEFKTGKDGIYKIECKSGDYKLKITAKGYKGYTYDGSIGVEADTEIAISTVKLSKSGDTKPKTTTAPKIKTSYSEADLKRTVSAKSGGNIKDWFYEDFEGSGNKGGFALVDVYGSMTVYYIDSSNKAEAVTDDFWKMTYSDGTAKITEYKGRIFFTVDILSGGSGYTTFVASVKDGKVYELDISCNIQGFFIKDGVCYTTENDFGSGHHEYPEVELVYSGKTGQFKKGGRLEEEKTTTEAPTEAPTEPPVSSYKDAYKAVINEYMQRGKLVTDIYYTLYDMDGNGTPELIVRYGTCEADFLLAFYTWNGSDAVNVGDRFSGFHIVFDVDRSTGQFATIWGHMGQGGIRWYSFDGSSVTLAREQDGIVYGDSEDDPFDEYGDFEVLNSAGAYNHSSGSWSDMDYSPIDNY